MPLEIRPYEGTARDLSRFIVENWLASYQGKMAVPDWTAEYFDWQMTGPLHAIRDSLISAWDGDRLVGTLLYMPFPLWVRGQEHPGCLGSWLTVAPEYRRHGVASLMSSAMRECQQQHGYYARLGYAFQGARISLGPRFWRRSAAKTQTLMLKPLRLWARVLNRVAVADWSNKTWERMLLKLLPSVACQVARPAQDVRVRPYERQDLATCQELINGQARQADLAMLWTEERLVTHLSYGSLAHTLVVERAGQVVGYLNYHLLRLHLRGSLVSAVIDMLACQELTAREVRALLNTALRTMRDEQGVSLVLMREFTGQPVGGLLNTRFLPQLADSTLMLTGTTTQAAEELLQCKKVHVLWR